MIDRSVCRVSELVEYVSVLVVNSLHLVDVFRHVFHALQRRYSSHVKYAITDRVSGPGRAIGPVCVSGQYKSTFDLDLCHADASSS